jgi:hypothetical protein
LSNQLKSPSPVPAAKSAATYRPGFAAPGNAAATPSKLDELRLLVNSRHPIISAETPEEERIESLLSNVALELDVPLYTWSVTNGLARMKGAPLYNTDAPEQALTNIELIHGDGIFILKDFARYCDNDKICRRLRDLRRNFAGSAGRL